MLKTRINGLSFFAHLSDEYGTAPETKWHKAGKSAMLATLASMGIQGRDAVPGRSPSGGKWEADVLSQFLVAPSRVQTRVIVKQVHVYAIPTVKSWPTLPAAWGRPRSPPSVQQFACR